MAVEYINENPNEARKYLAKNTMTPDNIVDTVPMLGYIMIKDMSPKQLDYLQKFSDFRHRDRRRAGKGRRQEIPQVVLTLTMSGSLRMEAALPASHAGGGGGGFAGRCRRSCAVRT